MNYKLFCQYASPQSLGEWIDSVDHVDLIDLDIQGAERMVLPPVINKLNAKVYRIIIGTHQEGWHEKLKDLFVKKHGWIVIWEVNSKNDKSSKDCVRHFR